MLNLPNTEEQRCHDSSDMCQKFPYPQLILKPEIAVVTSGSVQFKAFLRTRVGEVELGQGLQFHSDNTLVAAVNSTTGLASIIADGTCQITVYWQNLRAYSHINVRASCMDSVNTFEVLVDTSRSMADRFNQVFDTKLDVARLMAWQFAVGVNLNKDFLGLIEFTTYPNEIVPVGNLPIMPSEMSQLQKTDSATLFLPALQLAVSNIQANTASNRGVIVIFSDGESNPSMSEQQLIEIKDLANTFKKAGGVIIGVAIRASGHGYELMQHLASTGYFVNVLSDKGETHVDRCMSVISGLMQFLCAPIPSLQLAYLYSPPSTNFPVTPQIADPDPLECDGELRGVKPHYRATMAYNNGSSPVTATCNSQVSKADAEQLALELAMLRWTLLQSFGAYD